MRYSSLHPFFLSSLLFPLGGVENRQSDECLLPIVEEDALVGHFAVGGGGVIFEVDVEDVGFVVVVEPEWVNG